MVFPKEAFTVDSAEVKPLEDNKEDQAKSFGEGNIEIPAENPEDEHVKPRVSLVSI